MKEGVNFHSYCAGDMEIANEMNVLSVHTIEISVCFSMSFRGKKKQQTNKHKERDKILI